MYKQPGITKMQETFFYPAVMQQNLEVLSRMKSYPSVAYWNWKKWIILYFYLCEAF